MKDIFGVSMTHIMIAMVVLLAIALSTVVWVFLRQRIFFMIGVRNIPRRRAQTTLIILGLMLSTLIISSALGTGDTVDHSITNIAYTTLGHVDELVQVKATTDTSMHMGDAGLFAPGAVPVAGYQDLKAALGNDPAIDSISPILRQPAAVLNPRTSLKKPLTFVTGVDPSTLGDLAGDIRLTNGHTADVAALGPNEFYINKALADETDSVVGDTLQVFVGNQSPEFKVAGVVGNTFIAGSSGGGQYNMGSVLPLDVAQKLFGRSDYDYIAVSNRGGIRDGMALSLTVSDKIDSVVGSSGLQANSLKKDIVDQATTMGSVMVTMFVVLGLFSIGAGMLLIFLIFVMLAAERKSEMGMARAVGTKRLHLIEMFMSEGMAYNVLSAAVGAGLGLVVAWAMTTVMAAVMSQFNVAIVFHVTARSLIVAYAVGVVLTFFTVTFSSWRVSALNIVRAIRDIPDPQLRRTGRRSLYAGIVLLLLGTLSTAGGLSGHNAFGFGMGISIAVIGLALLLRFLAVPERLVFTTLGGAILLFWILTAGGTFDFLTGKLNGGMELFFLSGVIMVGSCTFVLIYNADVVLSAVTMAGNHFGRLLPAFKTAVAYPMANKFRTGMTVAMISLVVFALVMQSTMNANFNKMFLSDTARGGWDIMVQESPTSRITDLAGDLQASGRFDVSQLTTVGRIDIPNLLRAQVRQGNSGDWSSYTIAGADATFVDNSTLPLQIRARGYDSDRAVWDALRTEPDVAVIDNFAMPSAGSFSMGGFMLSGVSGTDKVIDPIPVQVQDAGTTRARTVRIIGIMEMGPSASFYGLYMSPNVITDVFGKSEYSRYYVKLAPGLNAKTTAKSMEAALLEKGAQATSLKAQIDEQQQLSRAFSWLMQAFMGLGLFVGTAAVGVVAFRTVVERRQQIGMLRAIGYTRGTVMLSFILESSFVALMGVISGIVLAVALSYELLNSDAWTTAGLPNFFVPWGQVAIIAVFAFGSSFLMTLIPSRQASSIPIAAALRYE